MSFAHFSSPPMAAHGQLCAFVRSRPWAFWRAATAIAALVLAFIGTSFGWTTELITHCLVHAVSSLGPKRSWGDSAVMRPSGSMVAGTPMWYLRLPPRLRPPPGVEAGLALPPGEVARRTAQIWPQRRVGRNPPAPGRACSPGCAFILEGSPRRRSGRPTKVTHAPSPSAGAQLKQIGQSGSHMHSAARSRTFRLPSLEAGRSIARRHSPPTCFVSHCSAVDQDQEQPPRGE